jgi:hypothetical protein
MTIEENLERLGYHLRECAGDLAGRIERDYRGTLHYPGQRRRYDRDMQVVIDGRRP